MAFEKIRRIRRKNINAIKKALRIILNAIKKAPRIILNALKPLPPFVFVVVIFMLLAFIPMAFVWGFDFVWDFDLNDIAFQILVFVDIVVLTIFVVGLFFVGIRHLFTGGKKEILCNFCGKALTGGGNICTNCGKDNREFVEEV